MLTEMVKESHAINLFLLCFGVMVNSLIGWNEESSMFPGQGRFHIWTLVNDLEELGNIIKRLLIIKSIHDALRITN